MECLISVITDRFHTFVFSETVVLLQHMLMAVKNNGVSFNDVDNTADFVIEMAFKLLIERFPQIDSDYVSNFVYSMYEEASLSTNFRELIREFLISTKKVSPSNRDLFKDILLEHQKEILGLNGPAEPDWGTDINDPAEF